MLFFFELFLFVLVLLTLAVGEFISRGLALVLWLVITMFALVGYALARQSLRGLVAAGQAPGGRAPTETRPGAGPPHTQVERPGEAGPSAREQSGGEWSPLDERWAKTLLYNWRRANVLLMLGALAVGLWYWLYR